MIYALILSTILLVKNPVVNEPITITVNVGNCSIVEVVDNSKTIKNIKCDLDILFNDKREDTVEIWITIPDEK